MRRECKKSLKIAETRRAHVPEAATKPAERARRRFLCVEGYTIGTRGRTSPERFVHNPKRVIPGPFRSCWDGGAFCGFSQCP
jgi:hypothetical protein